MGPPWLQRNGRLDIWAYPSKATAIREGAKLAMTCAEPDLVRGLIRVLNHDLAPSKLFTLSLAMRATATALTTSPHGRGALVREAGSLVLARGRRLDPPRRFRRATSHPCAQPPPTTGAQRRHLHRDKPMAHTSSGHNHSDAHGSSPVRRNWTEPGADLRV